MWKAFETFVDDVERDIVTRDVTRCENAMQGTKICEMGSRRYIEREREKIRIKKQIRKHWNSPNESKKSKEKKSVYDISLHRKKISTGIGFLLSPLLVLLELLTALSQLPPLMEDDVLARLLLLLKPRVGEPLPFPFEGMSWAVEDEANVKLDIASETTDSAVFGVLIDEEEGDFWCIWWRAARWEG